MPSLRSNLLIPAAPGSCPQAASPMPDPPVDLVADGLTPLPSGGMDDLFAGLPDLGAPNQGSFGGLGGGNPFSSAGGTGGWAGGTQAANPYAAPLPAARPRSAGHTNKPKRSGLPWDDREHEESPFWATVKMVFFHRPRPSIGCGAKEG